MQAQAQPDPHEIGAAGEDTRRESFMRLWEDFMRSKNLSAKVNHLFARLQTVFCRKEYFAGLAQRPQPQNPKLQTSSKTCPA